MIPQGWEEKTLGEICDILDSQRKPITKKDRIEGIYPYYGATGVLDYVAEWLFDEELVLLGEDGAKWTSGENSAYKITGKAWVNNHAHVLRPQRDKVLDAYLIYNLNFQNLTPYITGTTVPKLNQEKMRKIIIPLPSLPEQERIVAKLDKSFEAIDKVKANAEQNLTNAKELFESALDKAFTENTEGWEEKTLGEICVIIAGQSPNSQYYNTEGKGLPFYQGKKEFTDKYIGAPSVWTTETTKEALAGDILMSVRAPVGPINFATDRCCIGRGLASIRNGKLIGKDFLFYYLLSIQQEISGHDGAVFSSISRNEISALKLLLPPLPKQERIVAKLDKLQEQTKQLEAIYTQKIKECDELKQSILNKAFKGEL